MLEREIEHLLTRPVGRPSHKPKVFYHSFQYQAKSWQRSRRVVAKIEWHAGELFPRVGFIVTNLSRRSKNVVKFCNGRGTAEQWIKEGKHAVKWTKLSCRTFKDKGRRSARTQRSTLKTTRLAPYPSLQSGTRGSEGAKMSKKNPR